MHIPTADITITAKVLSSEVLNFRIAYRYRSHLNSTLNGTTFALFRYVDIEISRATLKRMNLTGLALTSGFRMHLSEQMSLCESMVTLLRVQLWTLSKVDIQLRRRAERFTRSGLKRTIILFKLQRSSLFGFFT